MFHYNLCNLVSLILISAVEIVQDESELFVVGLLFKLEVSCCSLHKPLNPLQPGMHLAYHKLVLSLIKQLMLLSHVLFVVDLEFHPRVVSIIGQ